MTALAGSILTNPDVSGPAALSNDPVTSELEKPAGGIARSGIRQSRLLPMNGDVPVEGKTDAFCEVNGSKQVFGLAGAYAIACPVRAVPLASPAIPPKGRATRTILFNCTSRARLLSGPFFRRLITVASVTHASRLPEPLTA